MKSKFLAMLAKMEARKKELGDKAKASEDVTELRGITEDLDKLNIEIAEMRAAIAELPEDTPEGQLGEIPGATPEGRGAAQVPQGSLNMIAAFGGQSTGTNNGDEQRAARTAELEKRGKDLKEGKAVVFSMGELPVARSITIDTPGLVIPNQYSDTLNPTFNEVSSIVDLVYAPPMMNGETYTKGFEKPLTEEGAYTTDGQSYHDTDPVYDYVTIAKTAITAYTEISKQTAKLPNVNYQSMCSLTVRKALRKKLSREIMVGDGEAGHFTGIFKAPEKVIPADSDIEVEEIDADTLDSIVFGYGGDEDVEAAAYLILSKNDLSAFAAIRGSDGKKLYKIVTKGNTGTISSDESFSVNYIINSACPALSKESTASGTYCMAYGVLQYYEMPIFSDISVEMSKDYKFKQGMTCYAGETYAGGNVAAYKGFVRVKKA